MRLLSQSTRTTIRTLTLLFALTSLLLTMMTPFVGSASASHGEPYHADDRSLDSGSFALVEDTCSGSNDDQVKGGKKLDTIHADAGQVIVEGQMLDKDDLCNFWLDSTVDDAGNVWLYVAFTRVDTNGTAHVAIELLDSAAGCTWHADDAPNCNPWENRNDGSRLIAFTWKGNDGLIDPLLFPWDGTSFNLSGGGTDIDGSFTGSTGEGGRFGEFAVNLTEIGVLPNVNEAVECELITAAIPMTLPGFSDQSQPKDIVLGSVPPIQTCGSIQVIKQVTGGDDFGATFPINVSDGTIDQTESLGHGGSFTVNDAPASDTYTVSEDLTGLDGWSAESIDCTDGSGNEGETSLGGISVVAGETTTCTVTNTPDLPDLTIVKQVVNDNGGSADATDFTVRSNGDAVALVDEAPDGDFDSQASITLPDIAPGDYTITEDDPAPAYEIDSISCDDADGGDTATLGLGESATCWVVNDDLPGELELEKVIVDEDGLYPDVTEDDFVPTIDGDNAGWGSHTLDADTYTIGEEDAADSSLLADGTFLHSSTVCDGQDTNEATVVNGETVTCTVTNTAVGAGLTVIKEVNNDWGGELEASAFPLTVTDSEGETTNVVSEVSETFPAGDYTIAEEQQTGYELSDSFCTRDGDPVDGIDGESFDISVGPGETVICTFVNQDIPATVTLEKTVINLDGGLLDQSDFPSFLDDDPLAWDTTLDIAAGDHTASETTQDGYLASDWGGDCAADGTFTAELDTDYVCTITNDDVPGTLFINKEALNDDGGTTVASDFEVFLDVGEGPVTVIWTSTSVDLETGVSTAGTDAIEVEANTPHTITEDLPSGYTMTGIECSNGDTEGTVTVENGETVECTVFNDDDPATLTISKEVINDDGGTATEDDFTPTVEYDGTGDASGVTDDPDWDSYTVPAGEYTIGELIAAGYLQEGVECDIDGQTVTGGETATFFLGNGQTADCVVTNNDIGPGLTVVKQVTNDDGGPLGPDDFPLEVTDSEGETVIVESGASNEVDADIYTIGEQEQEGYELTSISCVLIDGEEEIPVGDVGGAGTTITVDLGLDETVVCTLVNDDIAPLVTLTKTVTNDDGGTLEADAFPVTFDDEGATWGEQFETTVGEHQAAEEQQPGYTSEGWGGDCATDGSLTTEPGGVYECTITNDDVPAGLTIVKEVVNDDEGTLGAEDFPLEVTPEGGETEVVDSGEVTTVPAGTYTISEQQQEDYELVSIVCDNGVEAAEGEDTVTVTVANGESVICTITNDDVPPVVIVGEILGNVEPVCDADAAYLTYEAFTQNVDGETVTIHWFDADGVEQHTDVVEGLSGRVLWPGAVVDEDGFATDWPGFVFDGEVWEEGDDGFGWANGAVTVTLQVELTTDPLAATYPSDADAAAGEDCLPPEIEVAGEQFEQPAPELPRTGLDTARMALWAALLAGLGVMILLATDTPTATVRQRR